MINNKIKAILFDLDGTLLPMNEDRFTNGYFELICKTLKPLGYEKDKSKQYSLAVRRVLVLYKLVSLKLHQTSTRLTKSTRKFGLNTANKKQTITKWDTPW